MEKKESSTSNPQGMCEKLFTALHLNPTFRPVRRLTFSNQETTPNFTSSNSSNKIRNPSPPRNPLAPPRQEPVTPENKPAMVVQPKMPRPQTPLPQPEKKPDMVVQPVLLRPQTSLPQPEKKPDVVVQPELPRPYIPLPQPAPPPQQKAKVEPALAQQEKAKVTSSNGATPTSITAAKVEGGQGKDKPSNGVVPVPVPTPPPQKALPTPQPPRGAIAPARKTRNVDDRSQDYINRARRTIRTTSNTGAKRGSSLQEKIG